MLFIRGMIFSQKNRADEPYWNCLPVWKFRQKISADDLFWTFWPNLEPGIPHFGEIIPKKPILQPAVQTFRDLRNLNRPNYFFVDNCDCSLVSFLIWRDVVEKIYSEA